MIDPSLSLEKVRRVLSYDPDTGIFRWLVRVSPRAGPGDIACAKSQRGYIVIGIDGCQYLAHRLAWFYVHGVWPALPIDHRNGIKSDNRMANLRSVEHAINMQNKRAAMGTSKTGYLGIVRRKKDGRYEARIWANGERICVGAFDDPGQAHEAYLTAKRQLHPGCTI